jgi:hypothetical protein
VAGDFAYLADGYDGLRVVDLSDPTAPIEVGWLDTPGYAHDVALAGKLAVLAASYGGLRLIDVSTPSNPVELGVFYGADRPNRVTTTGHYAIVVSSFLVNGLWVIDVSTPSTPVEVGSIEFYPPARDVAILHSNAIVAAGGVLSFDLIECLGEIFSDSFESGDSSAWSNAMP